MRCKSGELAIVTRSRSGNLGCLVHVMHDSGMRDDGLFWWHVVTLAWSNVEGMGRVPPGYQALIADSDMRPIRGGPGRDESLEWAKVPRQSFGVITMDSPYRNTDKARRSDPSWRKE